MVSFSRLTIRNFKRFAGEHDIRLKGDGRVTIIAAQNGVGKTTTMDAIHVALYGKRGFSSLYPEGDFHKWLEAAYSVEGKGDRHILLALDIDDPIQGTIRISRTYWLMGEEYGGVEEEVGVEISGKPLPREPGESRTGLAERWIEDYLPHAAMRRFLVDGERLNDLDPKRIDDEIVRGIDDVIGIGLLHRLKHHLNSTKRSTLRALTPEDQIDSVSKLLDLLEKYKEEKGASKSQLEACQSVLEASNSRIVEIQEEIENLTREGGSKNAKLRLDYAIRQSELTSSRRDVHQHLMESLPFVVAGLPSDLSEWQIEEVVAEKRSSEKIEEQVEFLRVVVDDAAVGKITRKKLFQSGERLSESTRKGRVNSPISDLDLGAIEVLVKCHSSLGMEDAGARVRDSVSEAISRLGEFEETEAELREAASGFGITEKAAELKRLATEVGTLQAEVARLRGEEQQAEENRRQVEGRLEKIRQREDGDSLLNRRITRIGQLETLYKMVTSSVRESFAAPLEEAFSEGFELLSRKSGGLEKVSIDTSDYYTHLTMRGFEGNWLERDLSATERQHVGLALVYALRRARAIGDWFTPLPVVVDTPTSRMDHEHKSWSITRFYPQLSNQVIVFATSDDLAGGLFEELLSSGAVGSQLRIRETTENSVEVITSDLSAFFGG